MGIIKIATGSNITYNIYGEETPSLPTVLCINGLFLNMDQYSDIAPHIAKKLGRPLRIITYNGQGIADSSNFDRPITVDDQINEIIGVMDALQVQQAHVVAMSSGTYPALLALKDHANRFASFCGYGTFSPFSTRLADTLHYFESLDFAFYDVRHMLRERVSKINFEDFFDLFCTQIERKLPRKPLLQTLEVTRIASVKVILDLIKQYKIIPPALDMLQRANIPSIYLYGEKDEVTSPEMGWELNENVPGSTLVTIPKETHLSPALNSASAKRIFDYYVEMLERWI
jgi:pimeloyl-ACP methyl ester carboxylesterase